MPQNPTVHAHPRALGDHGQGKRSQLSILQEDVRELQRFYSSFKLSDLCGFRAVMGNWSWSVNTGKYHAFAISRLGGDSVVSAAPLGRFRWIVGIEVWVLRGELSIDLRQVLF